MSKVIQSSQPWRIVKPTRKDKFKKMCKDNGFLPLLEECPSGGIKALCSNYKTCKECKEYWGGTEE